MQEADVIRVYEPRSTLGLKLAVMALLVLIPSGSCTGVEQSNRELAEVDLGTIDWDRPTVLAEQGVFPDRGGIDEPAEFQFGILSWATFGDGGRVFAGDEGARQLRVFSSEGKPLARHGRLGDGPGEYRSIGWVGRCSPNSVTVFDYTLDRLTELSYSGEVLGTRRIPDEAGYVVQMVRCHSSGRYVIAQRDITSISEEEGRYRTGFLLQSMSGLDGSVDDVGYVMGEDRYRYPSSDMPATLGGSIALAVDRDRAFLAGGKEARIVEIDVTTGDTTRVISWEPFETPVDGGIREAVIKADLDAVREYVPEGTLATRRELWERTEFPDHLPETYDLFLDEVTGILWVEVRRPPVEDTTEGSVLLGVSLSSSDPPSVLRLPSRYTPYTIFSSAMIGKRRDEFDVGLLAPRRLVR